MVEKRVVYAPKFVRILAATALLVGILGMALAAQPAYSYAKELPGGKVPQLLAEAEADPSITPDAIRQALDEAIARAEQDEADAEAIAAEAQGAQFDAEVAVRDAQEAVDNAKKEQQAAEEKLREAQKAAEEAGATDEALAQAKEAADAAAAKLDEANRKAEQAAAATKQAEEALGEAEYYKQDMDDTVAYYYETMDKAETAFYNAQEQYNDAISRGDYEAAQRAYNEMIDDYYWWYDFAYYLDDVEAEAERAGVDVGIKQGELEEAKAAQAIAEQEAAQVARDAQPVIDAYNALAGVAAQVEAAQAELDAATQAVEDAEAALAEAEAGLDEANAALEQAVDNSRAASERLAALRNLAGYLFDDDENWGNSGWNSANWSGSNWGTANWGSGIQFGWQRGGFRPRFMFRPVMIPHRSCLFVRAIRPAFLR